VRLGGFRLPEGVQHLYIPMGVGAHVDHLIIRDVGLGLLELLSKISRIAIDISFYPEFPYNEEERAVRKAVQALPATLHQTQVGIQLTAADIAAKIEGVRAYRSQISTFWEDEAALAARVRAALTTSTDQPTEHFYQVQQGE